MPKELEVEFSKLVAQAAERVLQSSQAEIANQQAQEQAEDPIIQMRQKELNIREIETMAAIEEKKERLKLDYLKMQERNAVERERIETNEQVAGAKVGADLAEASMVADSKMTAEKSREAIESAKVAVKAAEIMSRDKGE
jgi:hypothetical protein